MHTLLPQYEFYYSTPNMNISSFWLSQYVVLLKEKFPQTMCWSSRLLFNDSWIMAASNLADRKELCRAVQGERFLWTKVSRDKEVTLGICWWVIWWKGKRWTRSGILCRAGKHWLADLGLPFPGEPSIETYLNFGLLACGLAWVTPSWG